MFNKIIIMIVVLYFIVTTVFADTIYLNSGKVIKGRIIEKTDKHIKIDFYGIESTYFLEDVKDIKEDEAEVYPVTQQQNNQSEADKSNSKVNSDFLKEKDAYYIPQNYNIKIKIPNGWKMLSSNINQEQFGIFKLTIKNMGLEPLVIFLNTKEGNNYIPMIALGVRPTRRDIAISERLNYIEEQLNQDASGGELIVVEKPRILNDGLIIKYSEKYEWAGDDVIRSEYIYQKEDNLFYILTFVWPKKAKNDYSALFDEIGGSMSSVK